MKGIVDRIEGEYAVVETETGIKDVPISWFGVRPSDGEAVDIDEEGMTASVEREKTQKLKDEVEKLMNELFE
jgi:hypothetical protein